MAMKIRIESPLNNGYLEAEGHGPSVMVTVFGQAGSGEVDQITVELGRDDFKRFCDMGPSL